MHRNFKLVVTSLIVGEPPVATAAAAAALEVAGRRQSDAIGRGSGGFWRPFWCVGDVRDHRGCTLSPWGVECAQYM